MARQALARQSRVVRRAVARAARRPGCRTQAQAVFAKCPQRHRQPGTAALRAFKERGGPAAQPERSHRASSSNPIFELEAEPPSSCAYSSHKNITHSIRATTPSTLQSIPCRNGGAGRTDRKVFADSQEAANSPKPPIKKRHGSRHNPCSTETFTPTGHNFRLH